jgi:hypothetical protein
MLASYGDEGIEMPSGFPPGGDGDAQGFSQGGDKGMEVCGQMQCPTVRSAWY